MKEEEKQRKFQEALLKMLYPPPPSPPLSSSQEDDEKEEEQEKSLIEALSCPPEEASASASASSSDDYTVEISDTDDQKLTRAQRKRLRKSKLKEAASQRRKIIGPLLPGSNVEVVNNVAEGVRQNAATNVLGEANSCSKKDKLKKRRKSKKLNPSSTECGTSGSNLN